MTRGHTQGVMYVAPKAQAPATLPAGRELDALIAEKVMGWKVVHVPEPRDENDDRPSPFVEPTEPFDLWSRQYGWSRLPAFSTRIADAWQVVEKMRGMDFAFWMDAHGNDDGTWRAYFDDAWDGEFNETAAVAICRSALKAVAERSEATK